jgi:PAS domain S-box-containing protein
VIRGRPGQRIVLFAQWGNWWVQPLADRPFTTIGPDSKWRNVTHFGLQYAALLVDSSYQPPASMVSLPSSGQGVIAVAVVKGRAEFWQTWWFLLTAMLSSAVIVGAYFFQRIVLLAGEEQRLRETIETMPAMAFIARSDGQCTFANRVWVEFTGLTIEQTVGSGWQTAVHPDDVSGVVHKWDVSLASGEPLEHEMRVRRVADGAYRWFLIRALALRDKHGKILKWYSAATDIEDRKRAEQLQAELAHVNRISMLGELAASISHELKQPIAAAMITAATGLRWLKRDMPNVEEASDALQSIVKAGERANQIIVRLRSLYAKVPSKREPITVNEVISEMVVLLRAEATRHRVSMRADLADNLPSVIADRVQVQQVLMNLMLNGIEAMSDSGGVLTIESQSGADGAIQISVNDTGPGLPPDKADQIFDAFYTTKPQGSGMGLAICKSIVESHDGRIWANGKGGCGAMFHFTLPADPSEADLDAKVA